MSVETTSAESVYDGDLGLGAGRWKGENPGDAIEGLVLKVTKVEGTRFDPEKVGLAYELQVGDVVIEFTAWNAHTKRQLAECRPEVGDIMRAVFDGLDPTATNLAMATRLYTITVTGRAGDIPWE